MGNETEEMLTVVVLAREAEEGQYFTAEGVRIHSVVTRPMEQAMERAWSFIKNPPAPSPGMLVHYTVEVYTMDGGLMLKYL